MRVEKIEIRHIKMELVAAFETSMGVERHEEHILVRVDGEGLTGWGECAVAPGPWYSSETVGTAWHALRDFLVPAGLGREIADPAAAAGSEQERLAVFRRVRDEIDVRIRAWLKEQGLAARLR